VNDILSFVLIGLLIVGSWLFLKYRKRKEAVRKETFDFYKSLINEIKSASNSFENLLNINAGFFSNYQLTLWRNKYNRLFNEIKDKQFETIHLAKDEVAAIKNFKHYFINAAQLRADTNNKYVNEEIKTYEIFFNNIEGRKLDKQQRTAILTDEDNNLIIAGAGSGKTTTIVGKVQYIIDRYKVSPKEILLISFTSKSAATLASRINIEGIEAKTFHKFGKDIIAECEGRQPSIFDDNQFRSLIVRIFQELIRDQNYLSLVMEFFTNYLKIPKSEFEFADRGEYIQYIKDQNFRSYKLIKVQIQERTTYKQEIVKSIEECRIANFLLFNGIDYDYESPYEFATADKTFRQYRPDFTINQNGRKIYLEHFGISRNGNVPSFFAKKDESIEVAKKKYIDSIKWKRDLHNSKNTTLIETYSYEMSEGILFENLEKNLLKAGVVLNPKSPEEIWEIINKSAKEEVSNFITLIATFITLMKSNNYSFEYLANKNRKTEIPFIKKRNEQFIRIIKPIFDRYTKYLTQRGEIDFSDMINKAADLINSGKYHRNFKYVIIDEFQDISIGRYQLVNAIKKNNPNCKLFVVGDDWQSIYRFSGSDITLFKNFDKYFGYTAKLKIETTYRFHEPLIRLSSEFILKNPNQTKKELHSISTTKKTNYKICYSISINQDDTNVVQNIFDELLKSDSNITQKEILLLGRYSFDIERLKNGKGVFGIDKQTQLISYSKRTSNGVVKKISAQFMTVHKSKGLEADVVIILNCNSGEHGFPSEMSDDIALNLLLSESDQFENGEERRLFYVAMTRAKEMVYFVTDSSYKSKFILELETGNTLSTNRKCPFCKTADVVLRKQGVSKGGDKYKFYGCSNYLYGCEYTDTVWEK
jgi:DNA helicase-4